MKKVFLILFVSFFCIQLSSFAKELDYLHGHFEKFKSQINISFSMPLKLPDGRVLLVCKQGCSDNQSNAIFDPETDTVEAVGDFKYGMITRTHGVLLPNGKVLFIVETKGYYNFYDEYEGPLNKKLNNILPGKTSIEKGDSFRAFRKLPEEEQAKIYMPLVKKDPELLKKYNEFNELKEKSYYAQLFNPETKEFELTGRITNVLPLDAHMVGLKNGNVLITYNNGYAEIYDYKTGKFSPLKSKVLKYKEVIKTEEVVDKVVNGEIKYKIIDLPPEKYEERIYSFFPFFLMKDGRILGSFVGRFAIYDYDKDDMFISDYYSVYRSEKCTKLSDDTVIYSEYFNNHKYKKGGERDSMGLAIYDPYTDTLKDAGELLIPRGSSRIFDKIRLADDTILIIGGDNLKRESLLYAVAPPERRVEIFNPKTGVSKRIKRSKYEQGSSYYVLLDDGRVLLIGRQNKNEFYVPKNYKKKVK